MGVLISACLLGLPCRYSGDGVAAARLKAAGGPVFSGEEFGAFLAFLKGEGQR